MLSLGRLVTGDDDGYIVFWSLEKCLDSGCGRGIIGGDTLALREDRLNKVGLKTGTAPDEEYTSCRLGDNRVLRSRRRHHNVRRQSAFACEHHVVWKAC